MEKAAGKNPTPTDASILVEAWRSLGMNDKIRRFLADAPMKRPWLLPLYYTESKRFPNPPSPEQRADSLRKYLDWIDAQYAKPPDQQAPGLGGAKWTEYYRVIGLLMQEKQWRATLAVLDRAKKPDRFAEGSERVCLIKGRCLEALGRKKEALAEYRKLLPGFLPDSILDRVRTRIEKLEAELANRSPSPVEGSTKQRERRAK